MAVPAGSVTDDVPTGAAASAAPTSSSGKPAGDQTLATKLYDRTPAIVRRTIATDGTDLFWGEFADETGLQMRAASVSGASQVRTLGRWFDYASTQSIALGPDRVYWLRDDEGGSVVGVPKAGGEETLIALPTPQDGSTLALGQIMYAEQQLWVTTRGCTHLVHVHLETRVTSLYEMSPHVDAGSSSGMAVRDGKAYCGNGATIHSLSIANGAVQQLVDGQDLVGPLQWVGEDLYFVNNQPAPGLDVPLKRWKPGAETATDVGTAFGFAAEMIYDSSSNTLFWATGLSRIGGKLARFVVDSGATEQLLDSQEVMGGITQDAQYLYWLGDHSILRAPKPPAGG